MGERRSRRALFLMGPTASGKTDFAIRLRRHFPVDIISVDSAQVYRRMDIGTAKPDAATLALAPHALIDIRDPHEAYSAAEFRADALAEMEKSSASGRVPLLAGGTMLYFKALAQGLSDLPAADPETRARLEAEAAERGWGALHEELATLDPEAGRRIHPNDPQRIQRALEVIRLTGRPISELQQEAQKPTLDYEVMRIVACPQPRSVLHERIERRFDEMLDQGFLDEAKGLFRDDRLDADMPSMRSVGYRQAWQYFEDEFDASEMRLRTIYATRQLAKRQITWLRRETRALWYDSTLGSAQDSMFMEVKKFLEK